MQTKELGKTGVRVPVIGMGTWNIAPPDSYAPDEISEETIVQSLKYGIGKGLVHIDTSEGYGNGKAEELVGRAISGHDRESLFIATKVDPQHYRYRSVGHAAEASLQRLQTDYIDLYQMHWPSPRVPLEETMAGMEALADSGLIRYIGVSNFTVEQTVQAAGLLRNHPLASNQVKYNILARGIERDLIPFAEREGITIIAYSPFDTGHLFDFTDAEAKSVSNIARKYGKVPAQVYLNWTVRLAPVITIPKAVKQEHLQENAAASDWKMTQDDCEELEKAFDGAGRS